MDYSPLLEFSTQEYWSGLPLPSWPRDWTCVSCIGRQILHPWATKEAPHNTIVSILWVPLWPRYYKYKHASYDTPIIPLRKNTLSQWPKLHRLQVVEKGSGPRQLDTRGYTLSHQVWCVNSYWINKMNKHSMLIKYLLMSWHLGFIPGLFWGKIIGKD